MNSLLLLAAAALAAGPAQSGASETLPPLMLRALDAARAEAEAARSDALLDAGDRRDAQTQFARILSHVRGCGAAADFIRDRPEVMGARIDLVIADAARHGDRGCAARLAPMMLERWEDPDYVPAGQIALRYRAGAYLDAAGKPEGKGIMDAADAQLAAADGLVRWSARFKAIDAYEGAALMRYFDNLAGRMAAERHLVPSSTRNGIFALFGFHDRCDLVARVAGPAPEHCERAKADGRAMYVDPPSQTMVESARNAAALLGMEEPRLDETGLADALAAPGREERVTRLLVFVSAARRALQTPR